MDEVQINGVIYVPKDHVVNSKIEKDGLTYCIVRTYSAGVWAGWYDLTKANKVGVIYDARRLRKRWSNFTLSALANLGPKKGKEGENKYAMPVSEVYLIEIIEIIPCSEGSKNFITNHEVYEE